MNGFGRFIARFYFGGGATYVCAFPTVERRREVCNSAHTGNGDPAKWRVRCSDGQERKLAAELFIKTFDLVGADRPARTASQITAGVAA